MNNTNKVAIISDLHLNCHADNTNPKIIPFLRQLLDGKYKRLWILGDFIEGYQLKSFDGVLEHWDKLFDLLRQFDEVKVTTGNHDGEYLSKLDFIEELPYIRVGNNIFLHGNAFDPLTSRGFAEVVANAYGHFERRVYVSKSVDNNFIARWYNNFIIYRNAKKYLGNFEDGKLIFGHTHLAHTEKDNMINVGCWVDGNSDYLIYDIEKNTFELEKF
jgi:UDP-2,3-diacylglucosamine pyrophosphatase LpxH